MLKSIKIKNYKSIEQVSLKLGRVNLFIGENGAGKSNILEAIAIAGAASAGKLDNEFLASRGIRVTQPEFMRASFAKRFQSQPIEIVLTWDEDRHIKYVLNNRNQPYSKWQCKVDRGPPISVISRGDLLEEFKEFAKNFTPEQLANFSKNLSAVSEVFRNALATAKAKNISADDLLIDSPNINVPLSDPNFTDFFRNHVMSADAKQLANTLQSISGFIIYSPEAFALRTFVQEGQIEPLGINGQGLLKFLKVISDQDNKYTVDNIKRGLGLLGWFRDFELKTDLEASVPEIEISDQYLAKGLKYQDQRNANEGFFFLLFYFSLFSSDLTPSFFAVDNIDASLNPRLCERLMRELINLSISNDKQVLLTTHNPAVLDGLNLDDEDQRLFIVSRGRHGETRVRRFQKAKENNDTRPVRLSEAFLSGALGGIPKSF